MKPRRKLAIASWDAPREGNIYGKIALDAEVVQEYLLQMSEKTGERLTVTHFVGKAVGLALKEATDLNGQIILGKYHRHKTVDLSFLVQIDEGKDLAKVKIDQIDTKSLADIARELKQGSKALRTHSDINFNKNLNAIKLLPTWILKPLLRFTGYLTNVLGIGIPALGLEARPFGSCIITSVGMMEVDEGFAPPTPFAHVPLYVAITSVKKRPVVRNDAIVIGEQLDICATIDHRFIDGYQGAMLGKLLKRFFAHPEQVG